MTAISAYLFDTAMGRCGIAWGPCGIKAVAFPEASDEKTLRHSEKRAGEVELAEAPPETIVRVCEDIVALLQGEKRDLSYAELDLENITSFDRNLYALTLEIKPGETKTYGELARALGDVAYSQRVGQSLGRNPFPIIVPCHRVVGADGKLTGFSAPGGVESKLRLLKIEGAIGPDLFD